MAGMIAISLRKKGLDTVPGITLAGDGLAIETTAPTARDRGSVSLFQENDKFYTTDDFIVDNYTNDSLKFNNA